jgi:hypothetical protein
MARKKNKKGSLDYWIITLGILFSLVLGIMKLISGSGSWLKVFSPLIIAFIIVFVINLLKSGIKKI